jgi:hypothetical protein
VVTATPLFGTATSVTFTLASLASSAVDAGRQSDAIDLATIDSIDVWLGGKITVGTTPTINTRIEVWVFPSYDGTTYAGGAFGAADAAVTPPSTSFPAGFKSQGRLAAIFPVLATTTGVVFQWGVALSELFNALPPKCVVFVTHNTGVALNATGTNHELRYRALNYESA